jgi:hypothetical protein
MRKICTQALIAAAMSVVVASSAFGSQAVTPLSSPVTVGGYEIRNADRGLVKRVKVFRDGRLVATITLRRGETSAYCCAAESCSKVETAAACTTLKMTCDAAGLCSAG